MPDRLSVAIQPGHRYRHTFANSDAHIGSTSVTPAALIRVFSLSDYDFVRSAISIAQTVNQRTVISTPSSARMRAAYEVASSAVDILISSTLAEKVGDRKGGGSLKLLLTW